MQHAVQVLTQQVTNTNTSLDTNNVRLQAIDQRLRSLDMTQRLVRNLYLYGQA
jgi:hypothetical protein